MEDREGEKRGEEEAADLRMWTRDTRALGRGGRLADSAVIHTQTKGDEGIPRNTNIEQD